MRGVAIAFFSFCMTCATQASSLVYFTDAAPASTPSVVAPGETRHDVQSLQSAADPIDSTSVVQMDEGEMPTMQDKVSAIPDRAERATKVIRDGVIGSALPRHKAKPGTVNGKPESEVSATAGEDGLKEERKP